MGSEMCIRDSSQAAPLARRIKQLGMNATLMGAGGFVSQTFLKLAQKEGEGVVALEPGLPVDQMPGGKAFEQAYQSRYHTHIELHAPFAACWWRRWKKQTPLSRPTICPPCAPSAIPA